MVGGAVWCEGGGCSIPDPVPVALNQAVMVGCSAPLFCLHCQIIYNCLILVLFIDYWFRIRRLRLKKEH